MVDPVRLDPIEEAKRGLQGICKHANDIKGIVPLNLMLLTSLRNKALKRFECLQEAEDFVLQQPNRGERF